MPDVFIIIGGKKCKKSTTTRALTGAGRGTGTYQESDTRYGHRYRIETTRGTILDCYVQISSLQEEGISPQKFIDEINGKGSSNVLVTLWIPAGNKQPNGLVYIEAFLNAGWNIREIVVLRTDGTDKLPDPLPENAPDPNFILNPRTIPNNNIASQIRTWWQWL